MRGRTPVESVFRLTCEAITNPYVTGVARVGGPAKEAMGPLAAAPYPFVLPEASSPFHFTHHMSELCADIAQRMPEFQHVDMQRVLVSFVRCRNRRRWGLQAKLVPLRFRDGELTQNRRGRPYRIQQFFVGDVELRYVLSFYLPRFLDQSFDEKMITVFHELYHISTEFNGDIRRFPGVRSVHDRSQTDYDRDMADLARTYLAMRPPRRLFDFLRLSFNDLRKRCGEVVGVHIPAPKLIPLP